MPDAATIYTLIGRLWHSLGDAKKSVDCYVSAVKLNPYLWEAFLGLCDTGIVKFFRWFAGVNTDWYFFSRREPPDTKHLQADSRNARIT